MKPYVCPEAFLLAVQITDVIATSLTVNDSFTGFEDPNAWNWS